MTDEAEEATEKKPDHEKLLARIKKRYKVAQDYWQEYYSDAYDALRFAFGGGTHQWDVNVIQQRKAAGLPSLTYNEVGPLTQRVINDIVSARPQIKYLPVDDHADPETADILSGLVRNIEQQSKADDVLANAVKFAVGGGIGWYRGCVDYCDDQFYQDIELAPIVELHKVLPDPRFIRPDGSDMKWGFLLEEVDPEEFEERWPDAEPADFDQLFDEGWARIEGDEKFVVVADYWELAHEEETLLLLSNGETVFESQLDPSILETGEVQVIDQRSAKRRVTRHFKCTAAEILEESEFPADHVPLFPVFGRTYWDEGKRVIQPLHHHATQPQRSFNMAMSNYVELLAQAPKSTWVMAEGQDEDHEEEWERAAVDNLAVLHYKPVTFDGHLAPAPQRSMPVPIPTGLVDMANRSQQAIQQATGIFDAFLGQASNEKSGVAIQQRRLGSETSISDFTDNTSATVAHSGKVILQCVQRVYDVPRVARLLGDDNKVSMAHVDPNMQQSYAEVQDDRGKVIKRIFNPMVGKYDVVASARPGFETRRQEAAQSLQELTRAAPQLSQAIGDLMIGSLDFPGAQEAAKRLKRTVPPELLDPSDRDDDATAQMQSQMQQQAAALEQFQAQGEQMGQQLDEVSKAAQQMQDENMRLKQELMTLKMNNEAKMVETQIKAADIQLKQSSLAVDAELRAEELKNKRIELQAKLEETRAKIAEHAANTEAKTGESSHLVELVSALKDSMSAGKDKKMPKLKVVRDENGDLAEVHPMEDAEAFVPLDQTAIPNLPAQEYDFDSIPGYDGQ